MELSIDILKLPLNKQLDDFVLRENTTLLYYSNNYLTFIKEYLKCDLEIVTVSYNNEIVGCFPLFFKFNNQYGTVCNSSPYYGSNGGMVIKSKLNEIEKEKVRHELLKKAIEIIKFYKCIAYTFVTNPLDTETDKWIKSNVEYTFVDERIGQITHLPILQEKIEEKLIESFADPRPRNIRKAIKSGITVTCSNSLEDLIFLYETHRDNITAIGGIAKEKDFFLQLPNFFQEDQFKVYIAWDNNKRIGALLLFFFNQTVEYYTPAVVEEYRALQSTSLIIYKAMLDSISNGFKNWNWGGTWLSQGGVYDFKKKWNTTDYKYFYYTKINSEDILNYSRDLLLKEYPYFFVVPFNKLVNQI